jgi:hypothetical protein
LKGLDKLKKDVCLQIFPKGWLLDMSGPGEEEEEWDLGSGKVPSSLGEGFIKALKKAAGGAMKGMAMKAIKGLLKKMKMRKPLAWLCNLAADIVGDKSSVKIIRSTRVCEANAEGGFHVRCKRVASEKSSQLFTAGCNGWVPKEGAFKGMGGKCKKWDKDDKFDWCYVDKGFKGKYHHLIMPSTAYANKFFMPCKHNPSPKGTAKVIFRRTGFVDARTGKTHSAGACQAEAFVKFRECQGCCCSAYVDSALTLRQTPPSGSCQKGKKKGKAEKTTTKPTKKTTTKKKSTKKSKGKKKSSKGKKKGKRRRLGEATRRAMPLLRKCPEKCPTKWVDRGTCSSKVDTSMCELSKGESCQIPMRCGKWMQVLDAIMTTTIKVASVIATVQQLGGRGDAGNCFDRSSSSTIKACCKLASGTSAEAKKLRAGSYLPGKMVYNKGDQVMEWKLKVQDPIFPSQSKAKAGKAKGKRL